MQLSRVSRKVGGMQSKATLKESLLALATMSIIAIIILIAYSMIETGFSAPWTRK
jgi:hypothetical protein